MIRGIFFCPKVIYQVPAGAVTATPTNPQPLLFDFESVVDVLMPRQEFCNRVVSVAVDCFRIVSFPVRMTGRSYHRNELIFNFAIVLAGEGDGTPFHSLVRKLARVFRALEEQGEFLSRDRDRGIGPGGKVYALCEMVLEDLNNYSETMIPLEQSNMINIKLLPMYHVPPHVLPHHVPLLTVDVASLMDRTWDASLREVIPLIDGIRSISRITEALEGDYVIVECCVQHLLYYRCAITLDIFQFSNIHYPTPEIFRFLSSPDMQAECAAYVGPGGSPAPVLPADVLIKLYTAMRPGQTVKSFCIENRRIIGGHAIDVRRFITFGVIKGFLYRSHKFPVKTFPPVLFSRTMSGASVRSNVTARNVSFGSPTEFHDTDDDDSLADELDHLPLVGYLDGSRCLDDICTELFCGEKQLVAKMREYGNVLFLQR
ncbi:MAG: Nitrogen permease regulator 2 [Trizodia sp. TS-e1964]|nr:MAG: Nitrogen permease regulator 2 [Trizodia sp. TS-e1964]